MMMRCRNLLILIALLLTTALPADTIHLHNGDKLVGEIVSQDASRVQLRTRFSVISIPKDRIARIEKSLKPEEMINIHLKNGAVFRGVIIRQTGEFIMIQRASGEKRIFLKENIERLDWNRNTKEKTIREKDDRRAVIRAKNSKTDTRKTQILPTKTNKTPVTLHPARPGLAGLTAGRIRFQSMWRSAILPSWGQFWQGRDTMGYVWAGSMGTALTGMLCSWISYRIEKSAWDAGDTSQSRYDRMQKRSNLYFGFSLAALSIWALNIADAGIFSPGPPKNGIALLPIEGEPGINAQYSFRF